MQTHLHSPPKHIEQLASLYIPVDVLLWQLMHRVQPGHNPWENDDTVAQGAGTQAMYIRRIIVSRHQVTCSHCLFHGPPESFHVSDLEPCAIQT